MVSGHFPTSALLQELEDDEEGGDEDDGEAGGGNHSSCDSDTEGLEEVASDM